MFTDDFFRVFLILAKANSSDCVKLNTLLALSRSLVFIAVIGMSKGVKGIAILQTPKDVALSE